MNWVIKILQLRIAVLDYGVKKHILHCMVERGAYVKVFPAKTKLNELKEFNLQDILFPMALAILLQ